MTRRRIALLAVLLPVATCSGYFLLWPTGLDPEEWQAPEAPDWPDNQRLAGAEVLRPELIGPEAIAFDPSGRLVTGLLDGRVVAFDPAGGPVEEIARTGGRPLGMAYGPDGRLYIADARRGLVAVSPAGEVEVLATEHGGRPFRFPDDVAVAADGTVYFTDASDRFGLDDYVLDILEHRPRGRVLAYHPDRREVELVADQLYFANGIALGPDDAYLVVVETSSYRLRRVWLAGERRGQIDSLVDNLPGFPDNVRWSPERRVFWVAIGAPRDATVDRLAPHPSLRKVVARLPEALRPQAKRHPFALAFREDGSLAEDLQASGEGARDMLSCATEHGGALYLGSFRDRGVGRVALP
ncbi:MAG TPA: SMP-30/gluconolactonase/LRE family protein [Kofleriaceae bacterium]|nr:SMP-30/gluconolactonase/LRE family protein [Kofleriaceae bacterium]